mgnify:CR=1 FL=1
MKLPMPRLQKKKTIDSHVLPLEVSQTTLSLNESASSDPVMHNPFNQFSDSAEKASSSDLELQSQILNHRSESEKSELNEHHDLELAAAEYKIKIKRSLLQISGLFKESYAIIVFQAGSYGLRGALMSNGRHEAKIGEVASSNSVDFTRSITEVLAKLKEKNKRLPKRAILLTPSVVSDLIQLPVSPLRPRSQEQMQELIRWELESAITQQNVQWKVGAILVERGHMTAEQRNNVLVEMDIRHAQGGPRSLSRFGDLAVQLGYVERAHLEECFALQGKLVAIDDELEYGWQACEVSGGKLTDESLLSQEEDNDSSHPWLVTGMSKTVRRRWLGAFNLNGISLEAFYPIVGSAFASLAQREAKQDFQDANNGGLVIEKLAEGKQWLLEVYQDQLALISGDQSIITNIETCGRRAGALTATECLDFMGDRPLNVKRLYVASNGVEDIQALMSELAEQLNVEVQLLSASVLEFSLSEHLHRDSLLGIHGVANHYLKHMPAKRLSRISAREVKEQAWKSFLTPKKIVMGSGLILVCSMFGFLGWMYWNTEYYSTRLVELEAKYDKDMALKQQLQAAYGESLNIQQNILQAIKKEKEIKLLLVEQQANSGYRQESVKSLLKVFALALSPYVAISNVSKEGDVFKLKARSSSNLEGQEFIASVDRLSKPLRYQVTSSNVALSGSGGVYQVSLTLDYNADLSRSFEIASVGEVRK